MQLHTPSLYIRHSPLLFSFLHSFSSNQMFKGFKFETPKPTESADSSQKELSELTFQFSRISANEGSRLESFQTHRSPLANRSRSETQEKRRLEALEFQKRVS